jgi:hypothetical protein
MSIRIFDLRMPSSYLVSDSHLLRKGNCSLYHLELPARNVTLGFSRSLTSACPTEL